MSESLLGLNVAATRQNAGRFANDGFCCAAVEPGGVNVPAATVWANVIVVFGSERPVRLSHAAAADGVALNITAATRTARFTILTATLLPPAASGSSSQLQETNTTVSAERLALCSLLGVLVA
jgi:hypothetical protein